MPSLCDGSRNYTRIGASISVVGFGNHFGAYLSTLFCDIFCEIGEASVYYLHDNTTSFPHTCHSPSLAEQVSQSFADIRIRGSYLAKTIVYRSPSSAHDRYLPQLICEIICGKEWVYRKGLLHDRDALTECQISCCQPAYLS